MVDAVLDLGVLHIRFDDFESRKTWCMNTTRPLQRHESLDSKILKAHDKVSRAHQKQSLKDRN